MRILRMIFAMTGSLAAADIPQALRPAMTLHASFDRGSDADFARGDWRVFNAPDYKQQSAAKPGIGDVDAGIESGAGVAGSPALRFRSKNTRALFFEGAGHVAPSSGTFSFWLRL